MARDLSQNGDRIQRRAVLAWLRLARVFQKVDHASAEFLKQWGLSVAQFDVLAHLGPSQGITQQELADRLLVTKGNVCQLLDRMEQSGLIERRQEGRANRLFLTERGGTLFAEVVPAQEALITRLFGSLSGEEQDRLLELTRKLERGID